MQKSYIKDDKDLPREPFSEAAMLLQWNKFAEKLSEKGQKIMATYMQINNPTLSGSIIRLKLPNEGSKVDFDNEKHDLLSYLREKLDNHDIVIEVTVNDVVEMKYAFTAQEKYDRLKEKNPNMELLRKIFDLDF